MTTNFKGVEIIWEIGEEVEEHDHEKHYSAIGKGISNQVDYQGTAIYIDGEFDEIIDTEEA